jgi:hypothetical protein
MVLIWVELWRLKDKYKQKQIQHLATSKELIYSKWLKNQSNMKRLQNIGTMDDDRIDMDDIEHQGEDEDMTNIENNLSKKKEEERIKKMLIDVMAIHEFLAKNFFKVHLKKMAILPS